MKKITFLLVLLFIFTGLIYADDFLLGQKEVRFIAEKDTILVGAYKGVYNSLIFKVEGNDVEIFKLIVTYGNKDKDSIPVKWIFNEDNRSRLIDLEGQNRIIKSIEFFYKTVGKLKDGRATMKVYGIQPSDIKILGEKVVNFKAEKDIIPAIIKEGFLRAIIFKVTGNDVEISKLMVTYGNDETTNIPVKWVFKEGDNSRIINLEGNKRLIKNITFFYKTVGKLKEGKATVRVYGL